MDKKQAEVYAAQVIEALQPLAQKLNVKFAYKGGKYADSDFTMKLEIAEPNATGVFESLEVKNFKMLAGSLLSELKISDLGRKFRVGKDVYTLEGFSKGAKFAARQVKNGKLYTFPLMAEKMIVDALKQFAEKP